MSLHAQSLVGQPQGESSIAPWWKAGVVYHIYPRSFADANGDGVGDLRGIIDRLDHLNDGTPNSLGVSAIWLSPIYLSPGRDGGYDVADHTAVDPVFGTLNDFDELVEQCHQRGMKVILDLVLNHTSDLHPWFTASRAQETAFRDWYIWRDPLPGHRPPNNWRSFFGGPAWTFDDERGQYYLHTFLPEQPDLNWHHAEVQRAALDIVAFWLARSVAGFRLDVFNAYFKHPELPNNPWRPGRNHWRRQRHLYNKDRPELRPFLAKLRSLLDQHPDVVAIGETFDGNAKLAASYCDQLHMAFNFELMEIPWRADALQQKIGEWDRLLEHEHTWPSYVLSNHDNPRHASRFGRELDGREADARAKVAAVLLLTLRGTPFVYYGEEIGMRDAIIPVDEQHDIGFGRDPARTPMQWDGSDYSGFSSTRPWLPLAGDATTRNVASQSFDARSLMQTYRRLIWLRRKSIALQLGDWQPLIVRPRRVLAYLRSHREETMLIIVNLSSEIERIQFDHPLPLPRWVPRFSTRRSDVGWSVALRRDLVIGPYEATVFEGRRTPD